MCNNYYFRLKNKELWKNNIARTYHKVLPKFLITDICDCIDQKNRILIGATTQKLTKPVFVENEHFNSVESIKNFYKENSDFYEITDAYYNVLTMEELQHKLFEWVNDWENEEEGVFKTLEDTFQRECRLDDDGNRFWFEPYIEAYL